MNFKNLSYSLISVGLLVIAHAGLAVVTKGGSEGTSGVISGPTSQPGLSAVGSTSGLLGGMNYKDISDTVQLKKPFNFLNFKVLSLVNNPTTGQLTISLPYEQSNSSSAGEGQVLVGTITNPQGTFYLYVNQSDLGGMMKGGGILNNLKQRILSWKSGVPTAAASTAAGTEEPTSAGTPNPEVEEALSNAQARIQAARGQVAGFVHRVGGMLPSQQNA
jgi:hypothetical protein